MVKRNIIGILLQILLSHSWIALSQERPSDSEALQIVSLVMHAFKLYYTKEPSFMRQESYVRWQTFDPDHPNTLNSAHYADIKNILSNNDHFKRFIRNHHDIINTRNDATVLSFLFWQLSNGNICNEQGVLLTKSEKEALFLSFSYDINQSIINKNEQLRENNRDLQGKYTVCGLIALLLLFWLFIESRFSLRKILLS
ncbi:MAG TPA: hypothetical protein VL201_02580 [Patescibacteria group bacterium]|jgi:hypothetical protein|nr:hypothetical protein [Patescibacteria group bacterium]